MPTFTEITGSYLLRDSEIDFAPIAAWWRGPAGAGDTIGSILRGSFADSLLGGGIWRCLEHLSRNDRLRDAALKDLAEAVEIAKGSARQPGSAGVLWLGWMRDTAEAVRFWLGWEAADSLPDDPMRIFDSGMHHIRNGLPSVALSVWRRHRQAFEARVSQVQAERAALVEEFRVAEEFSHLLAIQPPSPMAETLDCVESRRVLDRWYQNEVRDAIRQHFWNDHLLFLQRLERAASYPSATVRQLIRSALERPEPSQATIKALIEVNRDCTRDLLTDDA